MNTPRVVLCMKWGTLYPAEYVNVLFSACRKFLSGEFRFVCLTNEPEGLLPGIEVFPVPLIGLDEWHYYNGAWPKIGVFLHDLHGLRGRCLFIDLDTVVLAPLDPFFEVPGPLVAINNRPWSESTGAPRTMSSIFSFELGTLGHVVDQLKSDRDALVKQHVIEQEYLHAAVQDIRYWPQEWIVSFKYHLRQPLIIDRFKGPKAPPRHARLVVFHGKPRPRDLVFPPPGNWDRFPHHGRGAVPWMQAYWAEHAPRN